MTSTAIPGPGRPARPRLGPAARLVAYGVPGGFLAVFFLYPVASIVWLGLTGEGALGAATAVFGEARTWRIAWFTTWQAVASTVLTLLVGIPGAWLVARIRFPGHTLYRAVVTVPFVLPTLVVASAFSALLGPRSAVMGWVASVLGLESAPRLTGTITAVLIAHVFFNYAVVVRTVGGRWANLDRSTEDAARMLGASPWRTFREVTWPMLRSSVAAAAAIVFLFTFTSFGIILILGAPRLATLEVEIYRTTAQLLDLPTAAALALLQIAAVVASLVVYSRIGRRRAGRERMRSRQLVQRPPRGWRERTFAGANLVIGLALVGGPLAVLVERSLRTADGYGLAFYRALNETGGVLFVTPMTAIGNSLRFAIAATAIAVVVGGLASIAITSRSGPMGRIFDGLLMLPLGVSAVTVGFGFIVALGTPPLDLRSSPVLIPLAQALVATPFVIRLMVPVLESIDPRLRQAASILGASPRRIWREIDLPIAFRSLTAAGGFAFAVSLGEFGATVFVARGDTPTLPIAIFRLLGQPGALNFGRAMAMAVVLMLVTVVTVFIVDRTKVGDLGAF
jgi:thiamine transport system permease protein